jgi:hypothetical protein
VPSSARNSFVHEDEERYAVKVDVDGFWKNGYTIVRGVYDREQVQRFRDGAFASLGVGGDLLSKPLLRDALLDGNMVNIAREILGKDEIVYAGDASFTINSKQHGYHKDNADRQDPNAPDWQGRYTILRFGIYLQDHSRHTGGLNLRVGSHNTPDLTYGKNLYVRTRPGDIAVWSLRTSHSGNGTLLSFPRWVHPSPNHGKLPWWARVAKPDGDRIAIFAALGLDDHHHDRYTAYLKTRKYMCDIWSEAKYDEETLARAARIGLRVRNVPEEIAGDETVGQNVDWQPLPY